MLSAVCLVEAGCKADPDRVGRHTRTTSAVVQRASRDDSARKSRRRKLASQPPDLAESEARQAIRPIRAAESLSPGPELGQRADVGVGTLHRGKVPQEWNVRVARIRTPLVCHPRNPANAAAADFQSSHNRHKLPRQKMFRNPKRQLPAALELAITAFAGGEC